MKNKWEPVRDTPEQKAKLAKQQEEEKNGLKYAPIWTVITQKWHIKQSVMGHV